MSCDTDALNHFDGGQRAVVGVNATAGIFGTFPQPYVTTLVGFLDQVGIHAVSLWANAKLHSGITGRSLSP